MKALIFLLALLVPSAVRAEVGTRYVPCGYQQFVAPLASPTNGALTATAGGALAATTYYVVSTWVNSIGETLPGAETSLAVAVNNVLNVAAPASPPATATGWNVYVSTATGTETKQNSVAIGLTTAFVEPTTGLIAGTAKPIANTTGTISLATAQLLTVPTNCGGGGPPTTAVFVAEAQNVRFRDDGTAPTAAVGMLMSPNSATPYNYTGNLSAIQFIQTAAGAVLNVLYYR